jgi:hypothetical protein
VNAGDHQSELLKSDETILFRSIAIKKPFIALEIEIWTLPKDLPQGDVLPGLLAFTALREIRLSFGIRQGEMLRTRVNAFCRNNPRRMKP